MPRLLNKKIAIILLDLVILTAFLIPAYYASADDSSSVVLPSPIKCKTFDCLLIGIIQVALGFVAIIGLFAFIYGGFLMLTSGGNAEQIKKAKDVLVWATLGIAVILGSWAFLRYILTTISTVTS